LSTPAHAGDEPPADPDGRALKERARRPLAVARARYEGSWAQDIVAQLKALDFVNWTTIFGAELLWSALPFMILLSSLANHRIDGDLSRHIGLNSKGAHIVSSLFRNSPAHALVPILTGLLFAFAGIIAVVASLQVVYERLFDQPPRGWRDFPRYIVWVAVLLGVLIADGAINKPEHTAAGPVGEAFLGFVLVAVFFFWTMHFLLAGRVPWRRLIRPALVTALLWVGLALFSSLYFSSVIVDDSKTYGTIGVVFSFLSWFILIGAVIVLGAACGAVWEKRTGRLSLRPVAVDQRSQPVRDGDPESVAGESRPGERGEPGRP
jgi:membrane protein